MDVSVTLGMTIIRTFVVPDHVALVRLVETLVGESGAGTSEVGIPIHAHERRLTLTKLDQDRRRVHEERRLALSLDAPAQRSIGGPSHSTSSCEFDPEPRIAEIPSGAQIERAQRCVHEGRFPRCGRSLSDIRLFGAV